MRIFLLLIIGISIVSCEKAKSQNQTDYSIICEKADSLLILEKGEQFKNESLGKMSFLLEKIGRSFIGSPYKAHTLEIGDKESLVINLHEFDCTTFVETCLALTNTFKMGGNTFNSYQSILKQIRYRKGIINSYGSRLHYFTDWITDNSKSGYIKDVTKLCNGIPYPNHVNFMSKHVGAYPQLVKDTLLIKDIRHIESEISSRQYDYIPKEELHLSEHYIEEGWIVAFTTNINGLDIIHTGITVRENNKIHLLHASSDAGKVVVSDKTLVNYIMGNKLQSGIILLKIE